MTNGATTTARGADKALLMRRRSLVLFTALAALWCVLSWFVVNRLADDRIAALVTREASQAREDVKGISENFERLLNRLQGLPAVIAGSSDVTTVLTSFGPDVAVSQLPRDTRIEAWSQRPDLATLSRKLLAISREMDVDIIWVMNASGDCVAAGNFGESTRFVGTNYADRAYFKSAVAGSRGRQYAMGRITNVPGLFFSAPVTANDKFLGAVTLKIDLPRLAPWVSHPHAFVTDEFGVIILAADQKLEMHALPDASVHKLPAEQRQARYKREAFETFGMTAPDARGLVSVAGTAYPYAAARSDRPQQGISVHVLAPVRDIVTMRRDAFAAFLLLSFSGTVAIALVFGGRAYLAHARQHRESIEASNESLARLNEHLDRLARMDPLTDAANRRHFQSCLEEELARAKRYAHPCSLMIIDIDHFKQVNDRHGHSAGDEALRHFVHITRQQLRGQDELGRLGGEEFAVLLPETGMESAVAVAERIRRAIEESPAHFGSIPIPLAASFGVACWNSPDELPDSLLQRADAALYAAKSGGRNRVAVSETPADGAPLTVAAGR